MPPRVEETHRDGCNDLKGIFKRFRIRRGPKNQGGFPDGLQHPSSGGGIACEKISPPEYEIQAQKAEKIREIALVQFFSHPNVEKTLSNLMQLRNNSMY